MDSTAAAKAYEWVTDDLNRVFQFDWSVVTMATTALIGYPVSGNHSLVLIVSAPEHAISLDDEKLWRVDAFNDNTGEVVWSGTTDKMWHVRTLVEYGTEELVRSTNTNTEPLAGS